MGERIDLVSIEIFFLTNYVIRVCDSVIIEFKPSGCISTNRSHTKSQTLYKRNSKIPKGHAETVKSEDRLAHGQQNETKDKLRTH